MKNEIDSEKFNLLNELICELNEKQMELLIKQKEKNIDTEQIRKGIQITIDLICDEMFKIQGINND